VRPPDLFRSSWRCAVHGEVSPLHVVKSLGAPAVRHLRAAAAVPLWSPVPLPAGWTVTGLAYAGDERTRGRATALACSGPGPTGGLADLVLVAEEPGIGLGAALAGLPGPDPGDGMIAAAPHAKVDVAGHPTGLWSLPTGPERCAFVGEAKGLWLWAVLWPADAGHLFAEHLALHDLREDDDADLLVYGAPTPRLRLG